MLEAVKLAKEILPEDIVLTIPLNLNPDFIPFIQAGVRDLGMVDMEYDVLAPDRAWPDQKKVEKQLRARGWGFQRRLPIFAKYVRDNWYSRKLSQLLDKYRLMIKQAEEKAEDIIINNERASARLSKKKHKKK